MKGKLAKIKTEVILKSKTCDNHTKRTCSQVLGTGPLDGSPEPECDPAYDLVGIVDHHVDEQEARGEVIKNKLII